MTFLLYPTWDCGLLGSMEDTGVHEYSLGTGRTAVH